jgi:glutathione peroxidase-family protein
MNAPSFKLKGVDGKMYSLEDFNCKCALVVFICNHCPYVKACINDLINLQNSFVTSELKVVGINSKILAIQTKDSKIWSSSKKNMR